jgi:hypothetical protein
LSLFQKIFSYLPFVLAGVIAVEQAIGSQPGATKKAVVLSSIDAAAKVGEQVPQTQVQGISALIDSVVAVLNSTGVFSKPPNPPAPAPITPA